MPDRPYHFHELTNSLCPHRCRKVEAKIVFQDGRVFMYKGCPVRNIGKVLVAV